MCQLQNIPIYSFLSTVLLQYLKNSVIIPKYLEKHSQMMTPQIRCTLFSFVIFYLKSELHNNLGRYNWELADFNKNASFLDLYAYTLELSFMSHFLKAATIMKINSSALK